MSYVKLLLSAAVFLGAAGAFASTPRPMNCGTTNGWKYTATQFDSGVQVNITKVDSANAMSVTTIWLPADLSNPLSNTLKPVSFHGVMVGYQYSTNDSYGVLTIGGHPLTCR